MQQQLKYVVIIGLLAAAGCSSAIDNPDQTSSEAPSRTAGMALTTDVLADTDLGGMRFTVTQVDCTTGAPVVPAHTESASIALEDMYIPGGNGTFEEAPYDADSTHLFADQYFDLEPGCYDVLVEPIQASGDASEDCWSAHQDAVQVYEAATTETVLILQCRGEDSGGLDVVGTVNHPPHLDDLKFDPSKFTCERSTRVCVAVSDPDEDPVDVQWDVAGNAQIASTSQQTTADGQTQACATIAAGAPGTYDVSMTALDMGYDANGDLVPIEELLSTQGDPHPSRATLRFPFHVLSQKDCIDYCECPEGFEPNAAGDGCVRTVSQPAEQAGETFEVCSGNKNGSYTMSGAKYPDGLVENNAYWSGQNGASDGKLNTVGVWACDANSTVSGTQPVDEWIGFSFCLDVPEDADYLVGMGADNQIRFSVDGTQQFSKTGNSTDNFEYWWVNPIELTAGTHIVTLEGRNNGVVAAFGAEIAGPFPAGSLSTDQAMANADYAGNILFSTQDMIGSSFQTGESSGYQCPDGSALDLCTDEPLCTQTIERECLDGTLDGGGDDSDDDGSDTDSDGDGSTGVIGTHEGGLGQP